MRFNIDTVREKGRLVADNERYRIHDFNLDDLTVSLTELRGGQSTRGHTHDSKAEVYIFREGEGVMEVGSDSFEVSRGPVLIPRGEFHRVVNKSESSDLVFMSIFSGSRNGTRADYSHDKTSPRVAKKRLTPRRPRSTRTAAFQWPD